MSDVRFAMSGIGDKVDLREWLVKPEEAKSTLRLAWFGIPAVNTALQGETLTLPALLVSYYYLQPFLAEQHRYRYRDWVMDSGAFSAYNSGVKIDLNQYIDTCLELLEKDASLTEVFALDVIGDAEASLKNCEEMWRQKVPAIPCYHANEPEEFLYHMAKHYPKIALGGVALERGDAKLTWLQQCFARVWPKKIHGFGMASASTVLGMPFHSVDATNWEIAPTAFGNWEKYGQMSVRGSNQDLRSQVKHYLSLEAKAQVRWQKEMEQLEKLQPATRIAGPTPTTECNYTTVQAGNGAPKKKPELTGVLDAKWQKNWWE